MLTVEQKKQFSEILDELGNSLDISELQYGAAIKSYQAVGNHLSKQGSILAPYKPEIQPQGSFMLGTMIKPISDDDDLDIDLVCKLTSKNPNWTQKILKQKTGEQIIQNEFYKNMLQNPDGRRCWTLKYREKTDNPQEKYHMDILPSVANENYSKILSDSLRDINDISDLENLAIRITDKKHSIYHLDSNHLNWMISNPFGFGKWFYYRANISRERLILLSEAIQPVPKFQKTKLPLQRVIQILKRHRDIMWKERNDKDDKPISIIITTLAAHSYNKETNIIDALLNVVNDMEKHIKEEWSKEHNKLIKKIINPVNKEENFADKWIEHPQRQLNFYKWLDEVKKDINNILLQSDKGIHIISDSMQKPFGKEIITKTFSNYASNELKKRESGSMKMAQGTGILGDEGRTTVIQHRPFGENE